MLKIIYRLILILLEVIYCVTKKIIVKYRQNHISSEFQTFNITPRSRLDDVGHLKIFFKYFANLVTNTCLYK